MKITRYYLTNFFTIIFTSAIVQSLGAKLASDLFQDNKSSFIDVNFFEL